MPVFDAPMNSGGKRLPGPPPPPKGAEKGAVSKRNFCKCHFRKRCKNGAENGKIRAFYAMAPDIRKVGNQPEKLLFPRSRNCGRMKMELEKAVGRRKEMAPKDCGEVRLAEKSKPTAGEEVRKRQIGMGEGMEYESGMV